MLEITSRTGGLVKPEQSPLTMDLELSPWVDIVAFSSTSWDDVHDRPRLLMTRCAKNHRVFFFQEPKHDALDDPHLELAIQDRVNIVIPHLRHSDATSEREKEKLIGLLLSLAEIDQYIFWFFSPLAVEYTGQFHPRCTVYDCMNEPSGVRNASPDIYEFRKQKLKSSADLIFTTDIRMCLDPCNAKGNVHLFADSKDTKVADWDGLWRQMSRLIDRTLKTLPPYSKTFDPRA